MKVKFRVYFLIIILIIARIFIESASIQIGVSNEILSNLVFCGGLGCFLEFKYQLIIDLISFAAYYIIGIEVLRLSKRNAIITASLFVLIFMLTRLYFEIGNVFFQLTFDLLEPLIEINSVLFWSIPGFIGIILSFLIMTIGVRIIIKKRSNNVT